MTRPNLTRRPPRLLDHRIDLAPELREAPAEPLLGAPRTVPYAWLPEMQPRVDRGRLAAPVIVPQAAE